MKTCPRCGSPQIEEHAIYQNDTATWTIWVYCRNCGKWFEYGGGG